MSISWLSSNCTYRYLNKAKRNNNTWAAKKEGYDAGKRVSDIERNIFVYTESLIFNIDNGGYNESLECHLICQIYAEVFDIREKYAF